MRVRQPTLWLMFFTICFGLGYPTLNRYDTTQVAGTSDSRQYSKLVVDRPAAAEGHWRYRLLVPYLAKPIYRIAVGHVGTWNPVALSLLAVNSAFCASTALMLMAIAQALGFVFQTGLMAALCYLLNFEVANFQLAGLVDSAEAFLMACLMLLLLQKWWNVLPVLGLAGGLAKETFVPVALLFACGWVWREKRKPWLQIGAMAVAGISVIVAIRSAIEGRLITPLQIADSERIGAGLVESVRAASRPLTSWVTWITFVWIVPFALRGIRILPKQAIYATAFGVIGAFALTVWNDAGGNGSRPLFDVAAPCACLAFAIGVTKVNGKD